jgi:hypothetical protein
MAVAAQELRLVVVAEQRDRGRVDEGEVPVVVDDVEAVRRLLRNPQRDAVVDGRPAD